MLINMTEKEKTKNNPHPQHSHIFLCQQAHTQPQLKMCISYVWGREEELEKFLPDLHVESSKLNINVFYIWFSGDC